MGCDLTLARRLFNESQSEQSTLAALRSRCGYESRATRLLRASSKGATCRVAVKEVGAAAAAAAGCRRFSLRLSRRLGRSRGAGQEYEERGYPFAMRQCRGPSNDDVLLWGYTTRWWSHDRRAEQAMPPVLGKSVTDDAGCTGWRVTGGAGRWCWLRLYRGLQLPAVRLQLEATSPSGAAKSHQWKSRNLDGCCCLVLSFGEPGRGRGRDRGRDHCSGYECSRSQWSFRFKLAGTTQGERRFGIRMKAG